MVKQMAADGWLGIGWPNEYGGQGRGQIDQFIFFDESMRSGAPVPMLTINTVGPTIMQFGTDEQKDFFLPKILAGELHFCIGYSEPGAGTDLASLKTQAVRDGDEYVINGQKMWTSPRLRRRLLLARRPHRSRGRQAQGHLDDHRRHEDARASRSIRSTCCRRHDINAMYFDDVRVPAKWLVGGENNGWGLITNQLNHERVTLCSSGLLEQSYQDVRRWAHARPRPPTASVSSTRSGCR